MALKLFSKLRIGRAAVWACAAILTAAVAGCVQPEEIDGRLVTRYQRAMVERSPQPRERHDSVEFLSPAATMDLPPLTVENGNPRRVKLSLDEAVMYALAGNAEIAVASFDPEISRERTIRAAAEFDVLLNAGFLYRQEDVPVEGPYGGGESDVRRLSFGAAQKLITGGQWSLDMSMTRTWDDSAFRALSTRYEPTLSLELTQPLLRGAWPEYNLARVRLARLNHRQSLAEFRDTVEQVVTDVHTAYWRLIRARQDVEIQRELLEATRRTLDQVETRRDLDAPARTVIAQVEATLRSREAAMLLAEKLAKDAEEDLARLMSHPRLGPLAEFELVPTTAPGMREVKLDRREELRTALEHSPLLEQARIGISAADINVRVAESEILPRLDVVGSTSVHGLGDSWSDASSDFWRFNNIGYSVGLRMEYPAGNRAARAGLRSSRLQRRQALARVQEVADLISQRVNERVRAVETAWRQVEVQRAAVEAARAQAEGLEQRLIIQQKTPEFLLVLLQAQQTLAQARRSEQEAMTDYNVARMELARITGTVLQQQRVRLALPAAAGEQAWPINADGRDDD